MPAAAESGIQAVAPEDRFVRVRFFFIGIAILTGAWILGAKDNPCLTCHGPFEKLAEATAKYVAPSGEKGTPHRYVPHNSKAADEIPECTKCHTAHPVDPPPAKGSIDVSKVTVKYCYDQCHHEKNLTSCKECHP
jgi:hypothetical protein